MADIEKITVNGTTYDVADATARTDIDELNTNKVSKSGDTMTGTLTVNYSSDPGIEVVQQTSNKAAMVRVNSSWAGNSISLQVGAAGSNRGIYDDTNDAWIMYKDSSGNIHLGVSTIGSSTTPVYIAYGVPTACSLSSMLSVQSFSLDAQSVSAGTAFSWDISVARSGYTPLGVVGYYIAGTGSTMANVRACDLNGTTVRLYGLNTASSTASLTPTVKVLYIPS